MPRRRLRVELLACLTVLAFAALAASCAPEQPPASGARQAAAAVDTSKFPRHELDPSGCGWVFRVVVYCTDAAAAWRAQQVVGARLDKLADLLDRSRPTS